MSDPKFPNPTPRMVFGAAAAIFLTTLTLLVPKWLILPATALAMFGLFYGVFCVTQMIIDDDWNP